MRNLLANLLKKIGLYKVARYLYDTIRGNYWEKYFLKFFSPYEERKIFINTFDPVRYGTIFLAIKTIERENIEGSFAEIGVFQGYTSSFIHKLAPERELFLFDTFEGFPDQDLEGRSDRRFKETNLAIVKEKLGNLQNIFFRQGYFPETALGLEEKKFSFVMLDVDLYNPTFAGLSFFYPRVTQGGYIFVHDYNSPESDYAVSRAVNQFMKDKPEKIIEIPDITGSVVIRKT